MGERLIIFFNSNERMWVYNLDPVLVHLGPLEIRLYGIVYVFGFFLTTYWLHKMTKKGKLKLSSDEIWDFMFYMMLGMLIGARVFMVFWRPDIYLFHPLEFLKIWEGGMSFHGAFTGIVVAGYWYCKKKKLNFAQMGDLVVVPAMFVLALGRIANFINGELVGRVWAGRWCVVFPEYGDVCRHPNMIYSFFERMAVFGWLWWLSYKKNFKEGFIFWNFVFWEGVGRIVMDFFREDTLYNGFSIGQWMSLVMVFVSGYVFLKYYKEDWKIMVN